MSRHEVQAEIAGLVLSVDCAVGQAVEADEPLLMIESMKMEIPVMAPKKGTIAEIRVQAGDTVLQDQVLVVVEG
jgi:acetyl-CoA carboxylase biotin carboxyl carrier protein